MSENKKPTFRKNPEKKDSEKRDVLLRKSPKLISKADFPVQDKPQRDSRVQTRGHNLSKVYGLNACKVFVKQRPDKIIRAFFTERVAPQFSDLMKKLASQKKVYRIVSPEELERISQSQHHEGVCFNVGLDAPLSLEKWFKSEKPKDHSYLLVLENVGNPHNLGSIMRVAAHFGVDGIAVSDAKTLQSGAAKRTAEGGAEFIQIVEGENKDILTMAKKENYSIVTTSSHGGKSLYKTQFSNKCVLFFGEERNGLSEEVLRSGDLEIQIPGTLNVESLNVSSSISVVLGEIWRQKKD